MWIATFSGLNRLENNLAKFHTINIFEKGLMHSITYFLELNDDNILVGTESGVKIFNANDESIKDFKTFFNAKEDYFESLYVYSFYLYKDAMLWVYLWKELEGKEFTQQEMAELLIKRYGIDEQLAMSDSEKLMASWAEIGLAE